MTWETWSLFLLVSVTMSLSPGPAVFYVISRGVAGGMGGAIRATTGILTANVLFFILSGAGLGIILSRYPALLPAARWIGSGFLLWLGVSTFFRVPTTAGDGVPGSNDRWRVSADGMALQLSNPKAILFFCALLPPFLSMKAPLVPQLSILAATDLSTEFLILLAYGSFGVWLASAANSPRAARWMNRISGLALCAAAVAMLLTPH
jgi:homoserine/homoserine lactone efflux protein